MTYYVLGANGFIGQYVCKILKDKHLNVKCLSRKEFDITSISDYKKFDFSNSRIIDSIVNVDDSNQIDLVNRLGLKEFIDYLKVNCKDFQYIYISSTSTQVKKQINSNSYIKSKFLAENYIKEQLDLYKIIRLTFPFGKGENPNRLISRLINNIKKNESITIDNVTLNLTPITYFTEKFLEIINSKETEINFTDNRIYELKDIIDLIFKLLNKERKYIYNKDKRVVLNIRGQNHNESAKYLEKYIKEMLV